MHRTVVVVDAHIAGDHRRALELVAVCRRCCVQLVHMSAGKLVVAGSY